MKSAHRVVSIVIIAACTLSMSYASTYFVNASTGNDGNNGTSSGTAFKTITHALSVATNTDVINVAAGTYNVALGEVFPLTMVSGVTLTGTAGALTTIIDATGSNERVITCSANSNSTVIQGLTITGGSSIGNTVTNFTAHGGGISFTGGDQTILQKNIITGNSAYGYNGLNPSVSGNVNGGNASGGGIYVSSASPTIINNVISNNIAQGGIGWSFNGGTSDQAHNGGSGTGGGIDAAFANAMTIANNTFYGNAANGGNGGATNSSAFATPSGGNGNAGAVSAGGSVTVFNNIFVNNSCTGGNPGSGNGGGSVGTASNGALESSTADNLSFNLYFNNSATTNPNGGTLGTNNVMSDPGFVSTTNYHFTNTSSPAYHAGTATGAPAADFDGTTRGNPPSIGAYEGLDPLPVEMVSFVATAQSRSVELHWTTASEVNNYGFEVERRAINSAFTKVGFVAGSGSSASPRSYFFEDQDLASGQYSYRIKQVNHDGTFKYSSEMSVLIKEVPRSLSLSQNYPNPFNPSTTIGFTLQVSGMTSLNIYDVLGREVSTLVHGILEAGVYHERTFDASKLSSGIYYARLVNGNNMQLKKMILMK
jgi:hypothetical protein